MADKTTLSTPATVVGSPSLAPFGHDHRPYPHTVQFYLTDDFLLGILSDFIVGALNGGDGVMIVATHAHRVGLEKRLRFRGVDVKSLRRKRRYVGLDALATMGKTMQRGVPDFERFAEVIGTTLRAVNEASEVADPRVMVFGEIVALLLARRQLEFALMVEKFWEKLANEIPFSLFCGYPIQEFDAAGTENSFLRICAQHVTVSPPEAFATSESEQRILRATARTYADARSRGDVEVHPQHS